MAERVDPFAAEFEELRKKNAEFEEMQRINARPTGEVIERGARAFGTGANDAIGAAVGAIPDLAASGVRAIERAIVPTPPRTLKDVITEQATPAGAAPPERRYMFAPPPGQFTKWSQTALNLPGDLLGGGRIQPDTPTERNLYATGHGVGDAASVVVPAAGVARAVRTGTMLGGPRVTAVADSLASNPITQVTAGAAGGSAGQASDSPLVGAAVGMATPFASSIPKALVSPGASQLNPVQQRLAGVAAREGIILRPGQVSGSRPMQTMDSVFKDLPLTSGTAHADEELQRIAYNRAVLQRAGERNSNYATPEVVENALTRAGQGMTSVYSRNDFDVNQTNWQRVQTVADTANRELGDSVISQFQRKYDDIVGKIRTNPQGGQFIEGPAFAALDSDLSKMIRTVSDGQVRHHLGQLQEALRTGMGVSLTGQDAALLHEYRRQYANGMIIREAINAPSAATAAGHIPATRLSTVLAGDNDAYARGRGDLNDLSRIGRAFIQDPIPNSGTNMRSGMRTLLQGGLAGGGLFGGGSLTEKLAMAGGAIALPSVIQQAARTRLGQRYLTNQAAAGWQPQVTPGTMAGVALPGLLSIPGQVPPRVAPIDDERFQPQ